MKKLLILLTIASSLPIVGMDTTPDNPVDKESRKRQRDDDQDKEVSAAKRTKEDQEDEEILAQAKACAPFAPFNPDDLCNYGETPEQHEKEIVERQRLRRDQEHKKAREELFEAVQKGDVDRVRKILAAFPTLDIEAPYEPESEESGSILQYALGHSPVSLPIVEALLTYGANPNAGITDHRWTPLHYAIKSLRGRNQLECVKMLLNAKANPNLMDTDDYGVGIDEVSPLIHVARNIEGENALSLCKILLDHKADINGQSRPGKDSPNACSGTTPLLGLCYSLEHRVSKWDSAKDILQLIMKHKTLSVVELLLEGGADITASAEDIRPGRDKKLTALNIVSPDCPLVHKCARPTCAQDHIENIRTIHQSILECIQSHITDRRKDLHTTLRACRPHNSHHWPSQLTDIVADYWLGTMSPQVIDASSDSNGSSSTESASSESASSGSIAMPVDTTLSLDQE